MSKIIYFETSQWYVIRCESDGAIRMIRRWKDVALFLYNITDECFYNRWDKLCKAYPKHSKDALLHKLFLMYSREALS